MMIQDYDFLGKTTTDSKWRAVDGRASVCHTNAPTIKFSYFGFIKFVYK